MNIDYNQPGLTVKSGMDVRVLNGGILTSTNVEDGGRVTFSGGVANQTYLGNGAYIAMSTDSGTFGFTHTGANSATIATMTVEGIVDGTATQVSFVGSMLVGSGGIAVNNTVNSSGLMLLKSGASATHTQVNSGARIQVGFGATEVGGNVLGQLTVLSGGSTSGAVIAGTGLAILSSGGVGSGLRTSSGGSAQVRDGGLLSGGTAMAGGVIAIASGGSGNTVFATSGGRLTVASGGTATNVNIAAGATLGMVVAGDTFVQGVKNGQSFELYDSVLSGYILESDVLGVSSGGTATETTILNAGSMVVSSAGLAVSTWVYSGGLLSALNGGNLDSTWVYSSGSVAGFTHLGAGEGWIEGMSGGLVTGVVSGVDFIGSMNIGDSGTAVGNTILNTGSMNISAGGAATGNTIAAGGLMNVSSGGFAQDNAIASGGSMNVMLGGVASGIVLSSGGAVAGFRHTAVNSAWVERVEDGAITAEAFGVRFSGTMNVGSGGRVNRTEALGNINVSSSGQVFQTTVSNGTTTISDGGLASETRLVAGQLLVTSGGSADRTTATGGRVNIQSGATVTGLQLNGASLVFQVASNTYMEGSLRSMAFEMKNAYLNDFVVGSGVETEILNGGLAENLSIVSGGSVMVQNGGLLRNTDIGTSGRMTVASGGSAGNLSMHGSHVANIDGSGVFTENIISASMNIENGGTATRTAINGNSIQNVSSGGVAFDTVLTGSRYVVSGVVGSSTYRYDVVDTAVQNVMAGGRTVNAEVNAFGKLNISGGVASGMRVHSSGSATVADGFVAGATVANGGTLLVSQGSVISGTTVKYGGLLNITGGTTLEGVTTIEAGGSLKVANGIVVNFSLAARTAADGVMLNDWSLLEGAPNYTITISESQASGTYMLAGNAADFLHFMTVQTDVGTVLGRTFVGKTQTVGAYTYSLDMIGGDLAFTVVNAAEDTQKPTITNITPSTLDPTRSDLTITADFADNAGLALQQYRLGAAAEWQAYTGAVTVTENTTVYFRAVDKAGNETQTGYLVSNIDKEAPELPVLFYDVKLAGTNGTLSWLGVADRGTSGVTGYQVRYGRSAGLAGDGDFVAGTELLLENLTAGDYYYQVRAVDAAGNLTDWSAVQSFAAPDQQIFNNGNFAGGSTALIAKTGGDAVRIYSNGAQWGSLAVDDGFIAGIGDFNGDSAADFLRVRTDGLVMGEISDGAGNFTTQVLNRLGKNWQVAGTGDFDGDGTGDVLLTNPTGASDTVGLVGYWKGGTEWKLIDGYAPEWDLLATGDFNGDGVSDMLWRNSFTGVNGKTYNGYCSWLVNPAGADNWVMANAANPDDWQFLAAGDFNGNGTDDVAMINGSGTVGVWEMVDGTTAGWSVLSSTDTNVWSLAGVGDFNGDGTDDIAWYNAATQEGGYWKIENSAVTGWTSFGTLA